MTVITALFVALLDIAIKAFMIGFLIIKIFS